MTRGNFMDNTKEKPVGIDFLTDFLTEKYIQEYIAQGGSKIKFVTGSTGSGKTYLLRFMCGKAQENNFRPVFFSAKNIWLHDFKEIYLEILRQCKLMECLKGCALNLIKRMGYEPSEIPAGQTFIDYLAQENMSDAINRREIRTQLKEMFLDNPLLDNNFALACSMLTGSVLGYPVLEEQSRDMLLGWLGGDRTIKLTQLRSLGLSPARITKYNARHMLRSLTEVARMGGFSGLFVAIDDLEILISRSSLEEIHYTKMKREDTYESIRELIDDIDSLHNIMFMFGFDRSLLDDENAGIKSYQALWMRIQNEVSGKRFNRFSDLIDLDYLAFQEYTPAVLVAMSRVLADKVQSCSISPIDETQAKEILSRARNGSVGVPELIRSTMTGGGAHA